MAPTSRTGPTAAPAAAAWVALVCALAAPWQAVQAVAAPGGGDLAARATWVPPSDDAVVERLPRTWTGSVRRQHLERQRDAQALEPAIAAAHDALVRARRSGDPREVGLAQARLAPWWQEPAPPAAVRLLRGTILQARHDFPAALSDLQAVGADRNAPPAVRAQARLTQVTVLQVTGQLEAARRACAELESPDLSRVGPAVTRAAQVCAAELASLTGGKQAQPMAARTLASLAASAPGDRWLSLVRAELAERSADSALAERLYRHATGGGEDAYSAAAYADFLLDQGRPRDALDLLQSPIWGDVESDALQLRRAIALQRLRSPEAVPRMQQLVTQFDAARLRGERLHEREEARMALDLQGDGERAWALARSNWNRQKEPADAWLLARAAVASGRPVPWALLRDWVPDPVAADRRLASLAAQVRTAGASR